MAMTRPRLELVETARDRITIVADFPHLSPAILFDYWTRTDLLKKWWPPTAELQPEVGGTFHFSWPRQDWHLRGQFTMFDRGKRLGFTWKWDHEAIDVTRVTLLFHPMPKRGYKTHTSARRILEELGSEEDKGRTHRRLDFLSEEAPRARSGTVKPSAG